MTANFLVFESMEKRAPFPNIRVSDVTGKNKRAERVSPSFVPPSFSCCYFFTLLTCVRTVFAVC
jgi:hypothetical protein